MVSEMELPLQLKKGQPLPGAEAYDAAKIDDGERREELEDAIELEADDEAPERAVKPTSSKQRARKKVKPAKNKSEAHDGMAEERAKKVDKRKLEPLEAAGPSSSEQRKATKRAKKGKLEESTTGKRTPENGTSIKDKVDGNTSDSSEFDLQGFMKEQKKLKKTLELVNSILKPKDGN